MVSHQSSRNWNWFALNSLEHACEHKQKRLKIFCNLSLQNVSPLKTSILIKCLFVQLRHTLRLRRTAAELGVCRHESTFSQCCMPQLQACLHAFHRPHTSTHSIHTLCPLFFPWHQPPFPGICLRNFNSPKYVSLWNRSALIMCTGKPLKTLVVITSQSHRILRCKCRVLPSFPPTMGYVLESDEQSLRLLIVSLMVTLMFITAPWLVLLCQVHYIAPHSFFMEL